MSVWFPPPAGINRQARHTDISDRIIRYELNQKFIAKYGQAWITWPLAVEYEFINQIRNGSTFEESVLNSSSFKYLVESENLLNALWDLLNSAFEFQEAKLAKFDGMSNYDRFLLRQEILSKHDTYEVMRKLIVEDDSLIIFEHDLF